MSSEPRHDTVLVVDDEDSLRIVLHRMLSDEGCDVLTASDGPEAQGILQSNPESISVVVLDWVMPQMSGIELLRWMKKQQHIEHIPVIMLTALGDPARIKEGIDAGAFYYLVKPFDKSLLKSILRAAATDYHNSRQLLERLKHCERPLAFLEEATFRFRTIAQAEQLAVMIASATADPEHAMVIAELLMNAVEHGNLGIGYEAKGKLVEDNTWEAEIIRRLASPENAQKQVVVKVKKDERNLHVEIEDEGLGFDFERFLRFDESRLFDNHGRGIAIATASLNVQFTGTGNRVLVKIPLQ